MLGKDLFGGITPEDKSRTLKLLEELAFVGMGAVSMGPNGKKPAQPYLQLVLALDPKLADKLSVLVPDPHEFEDLLEFFVTNLIYCLHLCLGDLAVGEELKTDLLRILTVRVNETFGLLSEVRSKMVSAEAAQNAIQEPPVFLRYNRVKVEERLLEALQTIVLANAVLPLKRVEEMMMGCSLLEVKTLREQLQKMNDRAAELLLNDISKDELANQLIGMFDDFFQETEP